MPLHLSSKHGQIAKANNQLAIIVAVAVVISVFSLVSAKSLLSQSNYQRKVLSAKQAASKQLKANVTAANQLLLQYKVLEAANPNIIGGQGGDNPGNGPSDGDNARVILDALPSQYDFPALISSIEKIMSNDKVQINSIGGTDQGDTASKDVSSDQAVEMPFTVEGTGAYSDVKNLVLDLERSIRPMKVTSLELSGTQDSLHISMNISTYYQPAKTTTPGHKEIH